MDTRMRGYILLLLCCGFFSGCGSGSNCATGLISTTSGNVCGSVETLSANPSLPTANTIYSFKGIPYAEPPVGSLRFLPPVAKSASTSTLNATAFGPVCEQQGSVPAFFQPVNGVSEDCLTLNVWRPNNDRNLPVMVWIHGGEFIRHGSGENGWDGRILAARENVIVVSINYRLGLLGFLYDIADGITGNMGLKDQQLALNWVRNNIANFGGNPAKVTLFGWSAGAASIDLHTLSIPSSRAPNALFRGIITQSSPISVALQDATTDAGLSYLATQASSVRTAVCPDESAGTALACLQAAPVASILSAQASIGAGTPFFPIVDADFLVRQPVAGAQQGYLDIPAIIGSNASEGNLFAAQELGDSYLTGFSQSNYEAAVTSSFGSTDTALILAQSAYVPTSNNVTQYQSILNDYDFGCVNHYVATKAASSIFVYTFQEVPNTNVNWDQSSDPSCSGATCIACANAACHADEHPFMWNSLPIVNTTAPIPSPLFTLFNSSQQNLANMMQDYWGNFAKNLDPGTVGRYTWPSFAGTGTYQLLGCQGAGCSPIVSTTTTIPYNSCTFWDTQIGYDGLTPGS